MVTRLRSGSQLCTKSMPYAPSLYNFDYMMMNYLFIIMIYIYELYLYTCYLYIFTYLLTGVLRVRSRIFSISSFRVKREEMFVCDWEKSISLTT